MKDPMFTPFIGLFDFIKIKAFFEDTSYMPQLRSLWLSSKESLLATVTLVRRSMDVDSAKHKIFINEQCIVALRSKYPDYRKKLEIENKDIKDKYCISN